MEDILYRNIINDSFYLIIMKGTEWHNCIEIKHKFNNKFINNEELFKCDKLYLNQSSILKIINHLDLYDPYTNISNYNDSFYLYYKSKIIKINKWIDLFEFIYTL